MDEPIDWSQWPVLQVMAADVPPADAPRIVIAALQAALDRDQPFAAVLHMPLAGRQRGGSGAVERVRMLKRVRPGLANLCRGLAFVMPAQSQQDHAKTIKAASRVWGCPTTVADSADNARSWASGKLAAR